MSKDLKRKSAEKKVPPVQVNPEKQNWVRKLYIYVSIIKCKFRWRQLLSPTSFIDSDITFYFQRFEEEIIIAITREGQTEVIRFTALDECLELPK